ncbi:hypothetical protein RRF57_013223 [Xylaria bambusicola]|uniref:Uncharacterized protein n=1 Tax=Xylaria bambusicola TaxID=326684 RepID=A0AAN7ZFD2_9PEZI
MFDFLIGVIVGANTRIFLVDAVIEAVVEALIIEALVIRALVIGVFGMLNTVETVSRMNKVGIDIALGA